MRERWPSPIRALLVQAHTPKTYWGFQYCLPALHKAAAFPPLGLVSLAALLPETWELRLVDLNIEPLRDSDLRWASRVLVSGMLVQSESMINVLTRAKALGRRTAVGGPAASSSPELFSDADYVFQGEAEGRIDALIAALEAEERLTSEVRVYVADSDRPELTTVPVPRFDLLQLSKYASMSVQYSRGCPFNCEFCDIIEIFGRKPRVKSPTQVVAEFEALYALGYRGPIFLVDDNFIGNRKQVAKLLPELEAWQNKRQHPFDLFTEASVDLAAREDLVSAMVRAGFSAVFIGIESPSAESLRETGKKQNLKSDLSEAIFKITRLGIEVQAGFIVGFDSDGPDIFDQQLDFISSLPVPLAMVGLLMALPKTRLWRRLESEGRIRRHASGDQFMRPNFVPILDEEVLLRGYRRLLKKLYTPEAYFRRCRLLMDELGGNYQQTPSRPDNLPILARSAYFLGMRSKRTRGHYWGMLYRAVRHRLETSARSVSLCFQGEHMIRYTQDDVLPSIDRALAELAVERNNGAPIANPNPVPERASLASFVPIGRLVAANRALD